jgi:hypothetical protein
MADREQGLPPVDAWQAVQLRVTLFGAPDIRTEAGRWWKMVTGEEPESVTDQPKVGIHVEQGPFLDGTLVLNVGLNRYSWELVSLIDFQKGIEDFPKIGPFPAARDSFLKAIEAWLPSAPPTVRVAFGANVVLPRESKADTYVFLAGMLPFRLDPDRTGDFLYRVNRYATSGRAVPGLRINRLRTWHAVAFKVNAGVVGSAKQLVHEQSACLLELDINTDAERGEEVPPDQLPGLLRELVELGTDVIARGEHD